MLASTVLQAKEAKVECSGMSNKSVGLLAEQKAADYLEKQGFEILEQNWQTRWCEIDIVARHKHRVYFVEVKSRKNQAQGSGLDYITPKKLKQMSFAAEMWVSNHGWSSEYQLAAISVDGDTITYIENL